MMTCLVTSAERCLELEVNDKVLADGDLRKDNKSLLCVSLTLP